MKNERGEQRSPRELSKLSSELLQNGWKLKKTVDTSIDKIEGSIEFPPFREGEEFISDIELESHAINQGSAYGQGDAEWLFEHQDKLSDCPSEVRHLLFPGTEWEHPNGALLWPYLYRRNKNNEWGLYVFWRDFGFSAKQTRLVRLNPKK